MRIDQQHFMRAGECSKNHKEMLASLPGQSLGRNREHVGTQRAQRLQTFDVAAGFEFGA